MLLDTKNKIQQIRQIVCDNMSAIHKSITKRERKITASHAFFQGCLMERFSLGNTGSLVDMYLNKYIEKVSTTALFNKRDRINPLDIKKISDDLLKTFYTHKKRRFVAVDGTKISVNAEFCKQNPTFKLYPAGKYGEAMITYLYDVNNEIPIGMNFTAHTNERDALIDLLSNLNAGDVLIADRGYYSQEVLQILRSKNIEMVFRLQKNLNILNKLKDPSNSMDDMYVDAYGYKVRIINATFKKKKEHANEKDKDDEDETYYYLTTLNKEYTKRQICDFYHARWKIEELYKSLKYTLKGDFYDPSTLNKMLQKTYIQYFLFVFTKILIRICETHCNKNPRRIVSFKHGSNVLITKILPNMLFKEDFSVDEIVDMLFTALKMCCLPKQSGREYPRESIREKSGWYKRRKKSGN